MHRLIKSSVLVILFSTLCPSPGLADNADDSSSTSGNANAAGWILNNPEPYKRPTEIFIHSPQASPFGSFGAAPFGIGSPFGGYGPAYGLGYGRSWLGNSLAYPALGGWGSGWGVRGPAYGGWGGGWGMGGFGLGGFGLGGMGYGFNPINFGSGWGGANLGTLSNSAAMVNPYTNWGGYSGFLPYAGGGPFGWGGMGSPFSPWGGQQNLGRLESTEVIQTEPSKASGNYYQPSTVDTTASGSYYAQTTPTALPVPRQSGWTNTGGWSGSTGSQSSGSSMWGSGGSPFPKDLNSVPWNK